MFQILISRLVSKPSFRIICSAIMVLATCQKRVLFCSKLRCHCRAALLYLPYTSQLHRDHYGAHKMHHLHAFASYEGQVGCFEYAM
jgi:hypothetical protein